MFVTVSGPPGSGKSTSAPALAEAFDLRHVSGGDIFRELAAERGMTPLEFNRLAEDDESIDLELDRRLRRYAVEETDLVLESRLAGWLAADHADFKFWLDAPVAVRAERLADREGIPTDRARADTAAREESEAKRYREYYGIDIGDRSIYDLAVNTARWDEETVPALLRWAVEHHDPAGDEGVVPVELNHDFEA